MANKRPSQHITTDLPDIDVSLDYDAFSSAIVSQGVPLVHYKAFRCPVGMTDINDNRRPHPDHEGCQGGFIYKEAGSLVALFQGNHKNKKMEDFGFLDNSSAQCTFPVNYDEPDEQFTMAPFDRFYFNDPNFVVPMWQLYVANESGIDRLKYPIAKVEYLMDNQGTTYTQGKDFVIENGYIKWTGTVRPPNQLGLGPGAGNGFGTDRGAICSVRYWYRPYYYVGQILHDVRVGQFQDLETRTLKRMPQAAILLREFMPQNAEAQGELDDRSDSDVLRRMMAPLNGGYSPR